MTKRLVIKVGEYEGRDEQGNPKTKGEYVTLGVILSGENGEYALIDPTVNLAGCLMKQRVINQGKQNKGKGDMVMCSIFERDRGGQQDAHNEAKSNGYQPQGGDFDSDIPFSPLSSKAY